MTPSPSQLQCVLHPQREAAARCASCNSFFCRECVTEHDLRMLCAHCLRDATAAATMPKRQQSIVSSSLLVLGPLALGALLLWVGFYLLGRLLLAIPSEFHEGNIWNGL